MVEFVISKAEVDRISSSVKSPISHGMGIDVTKDCALHQTSMQRVASWGNTLQSNHEAHLQERTRRLVDQEIAQQKADLEEQVHQLEARNELIKSANAKILNGSDRMRSFSKAMMLSDVLAEREHQIQIKQKLHELERVRDVKYEEMMKHNYRNLVDRERQRREEEHHKRKLAHEVQVEQLEEQKARFLNERRQLSLEGERIRENDRRVEAEMKEQRQMRRQQEIEAHKETLSGQKYLKELKEKLAKEMCLEDRALTEMTRKKEEMDEKRQSRMTEIFQQKQKIRNQMIETQAAKLTAMSDADEQRVSQQVRDLEEAQDMEIAERARRQMQWKNELSEHRKKQAAEKRERETQRMEEERIAARIAQQVALELKLDEQKELQNRKAAAKEHQRELLTQISLKQRSVDDESKRERDHRLQAGQICSSESTEIEKNMDRIIEAYATEGRNVIPLLKALKRSPCVI